MPISDLTQQQKIDAIKDTYKSITGANIPNSAIAPEDQLDSQLDSLIKAFLKDEGEKPIDFEAESERDLANAEAAAFRRNPFSDFKEQVRSGQIESMAIFNAFMADNGLEFDADNKISPEELKLAKEFIADLDSGENLETVRSRFQDAAAQRKAKEEAELARRAEAEAAEAERLAKAEEEALAAEVRKEIEGLSHKFNISAFAKEQYDGLFDLNENAISFENGSMNFETQEYLHGMLRQANDEGLLDKYIGDGPGQFANKWDLRDAMYSDETPYDYENEMQSAQLSDKGMEILTDLTTRMGLDPKVTALKDEYVNTIVAERARANENDQVEEAPLPPIPADELPAAATPAELVASQRVLPDYLADFDDQEMQSFYTQLNAAEIREDREAPREVRGIASEKLKIEGLKDALEAGEFPDGSPLGNPASVKGDIAKLKERFEERIDRLSPEQREEVNLYLEAREFGRLPQSEAPRNPDGSIPENVQPNEDGLPVLHAGGGGLEGLIDKLSSLFFDETKEEPPQDSQDLEAKRDATVDAPAP